MNSNLFISEYFIKNHPIEAARSLENLNFNEIIAFLNEAPTSIAVILFSHLERFIAVSCLEKISADKSAQIIEQIPIDIAIIFLRRVNKNTAESILRLVSNEHAALLKRILDYAPNTAGALADPLVLTLPDDISVKEALKRIQKRPERAIFYLYILNRKQHLSGVISIRELMLAKHSEILSSIMESSITRLRASANLDAILSHPGWQEFHTLPVVEDNNIFLGAIHYDMLRRIEKDSKSRHLPRHAVEAGNALSELYRIGLSGLFRSATGPFKRRSGE